MTTQPRHRTDLRKLTSISLTPLDLDRIDFLRAKQNLYTVTDVIRQALVDAVEKFGGLPAAAPVVTLAASAVASATSVAPPPAPAVPPAPDPSAPLSAVVPPNVPVQDTTLYRCGGCGKKFRVLSTVTDPECPFCAGEGG